MLQIALFAVEHLNKQTQLLSQVNIREHTVPRSRRHLIIRQERWQNAPLRKINDISWLQELIVEYVSELELRARFSNGVSGRKV